MITAVCSVSSDEITNMRLPVKVNSSVCLYTCNFHYRDQRPSFHCGSGESLKASSECKPFKCDPQPDVEYSDDDAAVKQRRKRRQADGGPDGLAHGDQCLCTCLNYRCNCANDTNRNCRALQTWICIPGTINDNGTHSLCILDGT